MRSKVPYEKDEGSIGQPYKTSAQIFGALLIYA